VSRWHAIRIREDLYRAVAARAAEDSRSVARQVDVLLTQALEKVPENPQTRGGIPERSSASNSASASVPSRASVVEADGGSDARMAAHRPAPPARPIAGQTTVDEMLASCPNCAGEMQAFVTPPPDEVEAERCEDCGYIREPS
jgi:hypothetical protein